jgi:cyclophilin family peptidyl-prolyl cis-trans isomerase
MNNLCKGQAMKPSFFLFLLCFSLVLGCKPSEVAVKSRSVDRMRVSEARATKDVNSLFSLVSNPDHLVRDAAWRALANVTVENTDTLLALAIADESQLAFFSLSTQTLKPVQLRRLEQVWTERVDLRTPISMILGFAGDKQTRDVLFSHVEASFNTPWEAEFALALNSRFLIDNPSAEQLVPILNRITQSPSPDIQRAWLYGFYRSPIVWFDSIQAERMFVYLNEHHAAMDPFVKQTLVAILAKAKQPSLPDFLVRQLNNPQTHSFRTEVVRGVFRYSELSESRSEILKKLLAGALDEQNVPLALDILNGVSQVPYAAPMAPVLADLVMARSDMAEPILYAAMRIKGLKPTSIPENPALTQDYLGLMGDSITVYETMMRHPDPIRAYLTLMRIGPKLEQERNLGDVVRLGLSHPAPQVADFAVAMLKRMALWSPADEQNHAELVVAGETRQTPIPGLMVAPYETTMSNPIWILETSEGRIVIELDGPRTPASTHAIVTLANAGYYDGTFFHRVIQNFVIQAGLSFSGELTEPTFTVPTEGIEDHFERGSLGVASAGRDTEGGQFFIMHQWVPHLNGRYSNIGNVVEGMDVVDRIWQGSLIHSSRIERGEL